MEEWRDVQGYEGLYQVSNLGRVRSCDRLVTNSINSNFKVKRKGKILSNIDHGNGYIYVSLTKEGKRENHYVHRLVAKAFIPNPENLPEIDHKDHNRENNIPENLEWVSHFENIQRSRHLMRHEKKKSRPSNTGEKHISKRGNRYRVLLGSMKIKEKSFPTLKEAIEYRDYMKKKEGDLIG